MSFQLRERHRVFIYDRQIDFRAGFNKLTGLVREQMKKNLVEGDLFLFLEKNRKLMKAICFDGNGLLLLSKRMERGRFMALREFEEFEISRDELNLILSGGMVKRKYFGDQALTSPIFASIKHQDNPHRGRAEHRDLQAIYPLATSPSEGSIPPVSPSPG